MTSKGTSAKSSHGVYCGEDVREGECLFHDTIPIILFQIGIFFAG
jgi:hypothetical protein